MNTGLRNNLADGVLKNLGGTVDHVGRARKNLKTNKDIIERAKIHGLVNQIKYNPGPGEAGSEDYQLLNPKACRCCGKVEKAKLLPLCTGNNLKFGFLGSAYPVFFLFLKFCIILLILVFLLNGPLLELLTNAKGTRCLVRADAGGNPDQNF